MKTGLKNSLSAVGIEWFLDLLSVLAVLVCLQS